MGKKNLDKLFHEKLKDFSEIPDDKVWQSIEASLDKKKQSRKVIPIWWKLGGVAAVLLIALILTNPFKEKTQNAPVVTDVNIDAKNTSEETKKNQIFEKKNVKEDEIVDGQQENTPNKIEEKIVDTQKEVNSIRSEDATINQITNTNTSSHKGLTQHAVQIASEKEKNKNQNVSRIQVANSNNGKAQKRLEQSTFKAVNGEFDEISKETEIAESGVSKTPVAQNLSLENYAPENNSLSSEIPNSLEEGRTQITKENTTEEIKKKSKNKSLFDAIVAQEEETLLVENSEGKWSVGPSIAPVYYDALGEGSPVHSIFVPNSKSGDVNLSYGLSIAYEVSKKLSIRSGIHKVDYGYRTNDIAFSSSLDNATSDQIDNIDYTMSSRSLVVSSKVNTRVEEAVTQNSFADTSSQDVSAVTTSRDGVLEQQFGYLEVPVELNYAIVNNRFGINLIGGVSSLFLVDNSISLSSGELTTEVGEANNVNSINFSTNVGFGLNYKITSKVQLNLEPVFKYQLHTFSETDGTFNPFSIGVYSGLSFKF